MNNNLQAFTCPTMLFCELEKKNHLSWTLYFSQQPAQPYLATLKITFSPLSCLSTCSKLFVFLATEAHLELCSWLISWPCPVGWWLLRPEYLLKHHAPQGAPHSNTFNIKEIFLMSENFTQLMPGQGPNTSASFGRNLKRYIVSS